MRDGQFVNYDGQKVHLQTTKGPWSMFVPKGMEGQLAQFPPNAPVQFECSKPQGKNYWRLDSIVAVGGMQAHAAPQQAAAYAPPLPQQPAPQAPAATPTHDPKEEGMFVMGVVGRAMGSGNFSVEDIPALAKWAVIAWHGRYDPQ